MDYNESHSRVVSDDITTSSAVNSLIIDYYKKFGKKRDLEQYFALSTAQSEVKDKAGLFWRRMKSENDSSDSGEKQSSSSQELCRISIKCAPQQSSSQDETSKSKSETESPPIIVEEITPNISQQDSDEESAKSDDDKSQKSLEAMMDISMNKPHSPSSSITSQRKLEWDSLADVGYGNESDRKNSASSLSTLERLALKQQYSNSDTKEGNIGQPTAHSTLLDNNGTFRGKTGIKKSTKIYKRDVDVVEINVPQSSEKSNQGFNVNLTKHISFSIENDGGITFESMKKDFNILPEVKLQEQEIAQIKYDKEIQTSLTKPKEPTTTETFPVPTKRIPVLINFHTLKKRHRIKKLRTARRKLRSKRKINIDSQNMPALEKSGELKLSDAESFEYMPGHIYNQNHNKSSPSKNISNAGNKSSLESSGALTTDSSKGSLHSFTKDLEEGIEILKTALRKHKTDDSLKNKLVKEVVQKLLKSRYRDDDTTTEFLSGLISNSKKLGLSKGNHTTTSTSDTNNTSDNSKSKPRKSILRTDKFNPNAIACSSQSAPNLSSVANSDKPVSSNLIKMLTSSNTDSEVSSREKTSSDNVFSKTSSEELYKKYLNALKREEAYRRHLRDKEMFMKQKLACSDNAIPNTINIKENLKTNKRLNDLIKDLTRNNYDDGSGDASKLEGGSSSNMNFENYKAVRNQRSHSVFTLSSGHSDCQMKKSNLKKRLQSDIKDISDAGPSRNELNSHYCCCPHHSIKNKVCIADSSVQVNIESECGKQNSDAKESNNSATSPRNEIFEKQDQSAQNVACVVSDNVTGDVKYVCLCNKPTTTFDNHDNILIYKCSRLTTTGLKLSEPASKTNTAGVQCCDASTSSGNANEKQIYFLSDGNKNCVYDGKTTTSTEMSSSSNIPPSKEAKSSQTNLLSQMLRQKSSDSTTTSSFDYKNKKVITKRDNGSSTETNVKPKNNERISIHETTRIIQTQISINPSISDPVLSDIKMIDDKDFVQVIDEYYRDISKRNSDTESSSYQEIIDDDPTRDGINKYKDCCKKEINFEPEEIQPLGNNVIENKNQSGLQLPRNAIGNKKYENTAADNFTIPIQGTNMTLLVKIGSNEPKIVEQNNDVTTQGVVTDKPICVDEATSLLEECSKGVQSQNTDLFTKFDRASASYDFDKNDIQPKQIRQQDPILKKDCIVNTCFIRDEKFNTYPKHVQINERKPLLRSHTDTDNLKKSCQIQTDFLDKRDDNKCQQNQQMSQIQQNLPNSQACGCPEEATCQGQCREIRKSNNNALAKKSNLQCQKTCGTQNDQLEATKKTKTIERKQHSIRNTCGCPENIDCQGLCSSNKNHTDISPCHTGRDDFNEPPRTSLRYRNQCNKESYNANNDKKIFDIISTCTSNSDDNKLDLRSEIYESDQEETPRDPILDMIQDITKRYSKKDIEKSKRKKCFREIMTVLNYLMDTEDTNEHNQIDPSTSSNVPNTKSKNYKISTSTEENICCSESPKKVDKGVQLTPKKLKNNKLCYTESSELPVSTDLPSTSSDSATCRILNKIKKECERFHQKRCKSSHDSGKKCEGSSSTSVNCDHCKRVHHCPCRGHKCKGHRTKSFVEKLHKKCVAYNLIIQTSDSMISEETVCGDKTRQPLQNIIVKVPKRKQVKGIPFKELSAKIHKDVPNCSPRCTKSQRSKSLPNDSEISSTDCMNKKVFTVKDYLEQNRPDFVENSSKRQNCLKFISQKRANERAAHRDLLSLHVERQPELSRRCSDELRRLAKEIGLDLRRKTVAPKFVSEREMKKHSEKIYKSLPEVVRKKEEVRKENIKKTNLLMASMFKKNLQKKALSGAVNLSNYTTVIKI